MSLIWNFKMMNNLKKTLILLSSKIVIIKKMTFGLLSLIYLCLDFALRKVYEIVTGIFLLLLLRNGGWLLWILSLVCG